MTRTFVCFIEDNEWEGERWAFWLQVEGNEDQLEYLFTLLFKYADNLSETYILDLGDRESEHAVDRMVQRGQSGYMNSDNKVVGDMVIPEFKDWEDLDRALHKGGIEKFFREA